jgi:capsular exopolysaccharide synthesis family protein
MSIEGRVERFDRIVEPRFHAGVLSRAAASHEILPATVAEPLVSLNARATVAADQYRALRHNLESLLESAAPHVIAVTSPSPGDGKTVTTLNLAGALAEKDDARVLVIDADLRRASVAAYLGLPGDPTPGVADALSEPRCDLSQIIRRVRGTNLSIALAGTPGSAPHELLGSARFEALLEDARREFSWVLIDTPPCVLMPDCRLIERFIDGFLLVIAAHKTPRRLVAEALHELPRAKTLGVVFNADDRASASYYGYSGSHYDDAARRSHRGAWWKRVLGVR